jgi:hypothetical protein
MLRDHVRIDVLGGAEKWDLHPAHFEVTGAVLHSYACLDSAKGGGRTTWVDPSSATIADYHAVREKEAAAFAALGKFERDLRNDFSAAADGAILNADVWFAVEGDDSPDKDLFDADPSLVKLTNDERVARVAKAGEALRATISGLEHKVEVIEDGTAYRPLALPVMTVRGDRTALEALGRHGPVQVVARALRDTPEIPADGENYVPVTRADSVEQAGWDGTGIVVAHVEGAAPDSWANLVPTGACDANKCACPSGSTSGHPRECMGIIRNTVTTYNGVADGATVISANSDANVPGCTGQAAYNFVASKGATVINRSAGTDGNSARYLDYLATVSPYPFVAGAAGNDCVGSDPALCTSGTTFRNGLAVGGALVPTMSRAGATFYTPTKWLNPSGTDWELPHVAAPTGNITAGYYAGDTSYFGGTSAAAPVVSGIAAQLQQSNSAVKVRPEAQIVGILVGADENIDEAQGGTWPLNVMDGGDDRDGVGLINAWNSLLVLAPASKVNGGNSAVALGHDYGLMSSSSTPAGTYYTETYHALVPAGTTLRVAAILMAKSNCGSPPDYTNCTTQDYPYFRLELHEEGGFSTAVSANYDQNYQFASIDNTRFPTPSKWYTINIYLESWNAMTSSYWAVAWQAS